MGQYELYEEHTTKTNGKTIVEKNVESFYAARPFLVKKKLYDIDLPDYKMRALKFYEEYTEGSDEKIALIDKINVGSYNKNTMFREERESNKKTICLHFTAGWDHVGPDTSAATKNAVNYYVHRDGTIIELGAPELWSRNSSIGPRNRHVIAIELVNIGYLKSDGMGNLNSYVKQAYCKLDDSLKGPGKAYIDLENNPYDPQGYYPEGSYRGYRYYAAWTTDQMQSVKKLLKALCSSYDIPYKFLPPEHRFKYFPSLGYYIPTHRNMQKWCYDGPEIKYSDGFKWLEENGIGIISHVNTALVGRETKGVRATGHKSISKWDIGPAFDWNYLENNLKTAYPYQSPASAMKEPKPLHWFDNPEQKNKGGYFPIGRNGTAHAGMHLFAPTRGSQVVSALAGGSVVAFRFYSSDQRRGQEENRPEELRNLSNPKRIINMKINRCEAA